MSHIKSVRLSRTSAFTALLLLVYSMQTGFAGDGKISGIVRDKVRREPLVGATVRILQTNFGAASDSTGHFVILNVPSGTYSLEAMYVGYKRGAITTVRVSPDRSLILDFFLEEGEVELGTIDVYPVIDIRRTMPRTNVGAEDLSALPLRGVSAILNLSVCSVGSFVRGGKQYETRTVVDGIDVTDQFYAASADQTTTPYLTYNAITRQSQAATASVVNLNLSSLQEVSVVTGTTNPSYSSATAGVVAYSLKAPAGIWSFRLEASTSQTHLEHFGPRIYNDDTVYARKRAEEFAKRRKEDSTTARLYTYSPGKYSYGVNPTSRIEFGFGGGISEQAGMYATIGYFNSNGRLPNEFLRRINGSLKANYDVSPHFRLTAVGLLEDRGRIFGWKNRDYSEDFRYFLEGVPQWDGVNVVGSLKLSHFLSPNTMYEVQASLVRDLTRRGFSDDNNNWINEIGEDGNFLTFADAAQVNSYMARVDGQEFEKFFTPKPRNESGSETSLGVSSTWKLARPGIFYERFVNSNVTLKGDLLSQVNSDHLLKAGAQLRVHDLDRTLRAAYIGGVFPSYKNFVEEIWNVKPKEYSVYVEDRMEFPGMYLNIGFRLDGLDLAAGDYANYFAPYRDDTTRVGGMITDVRRLPVRGENAQVKWFFSPRVGVSHPVSDKAAMYFSFSRQQQSQPFARLFTNYNDVGNPALSAVSRTDQGPIRSTNYDLGIQWAFADNFGLDVNAYYKDIENYSTIWFQIAPALTGKPYSVNTAFGYADSRGVEVTLKKNASPLFDWLNIGGRVSYAYSYIKQAAYTGGNVTNFSTASDSARFNGQLPFDDIRSFNTIEQNVLGGNSTLTGGYDRTHRIGFNVVLRFPYEISLSGLGTFRSGFYYRLTFADPRARELGVAPWNKRVDMRIEKAFALTETMRLGLYLDVMNALNWVNILTYNTSTLGQEAWEKNGDPTGGTNINRAVTQDGSMVYDIPREVYFGLNVTF